MSNTLKVGLAVTISIAVVAFFFLSSITKTANSQNQMQNAANPNAQVNSLLAQDETPGTGAAAVAGDTVTVNYTGKLQNGTVFDSSVGRTPFQFKLGVGQVIQGWDQGLVGMKEGGKRLLVIPASMAYGAQDIKDQSGRTIIPANSTLIFEVELLKVTPAAQAAPSPEGSAAQ